MCAGSKYADNVYELGYMHTSGHLPSYFFREAKDGIIDSKAVMVLPLQNVDYAMLCNLLMRGCI